MIEEAEPQPERPDVFDSYSRQDGDFTPQLAAALEERRKEVWVDRQDIPKGEVQDHLLPQTRVAQDPRLERASPTPFRRLRQRVGRCEGGQSVKAREGSGIAHLG